MSTPITGVYSNYLNSFFGNLDATHQQTLWDQFVQANGYSAANPPPQTLLAQQQFVQFAKGIFEIQQSLILSPDEVKKRDILFKTFDILLEMLTTLQNTVGVQGNNLIFYGKWQEQYTQALTRVPTYVGDTSSAQVAPATVTASNLDQLKFGYNSITAADIAQWWAYNQAGGTTPQNGPNTASFTLDTAGLVPGSNPPKPLLSVTITSGATPTIDITVGVVVTLPNPGGPVIVFGPGVINFAPPVPSTNPNTTQRYQENITAFNNAFATAWNLRIAPIQSELPSLIPSVTSPDNLLNVQWLHTFVTPAGSTDKTLQSKGDAESKARAEVDARDQQYIENIRSLRDVVQSKSQQVQSNLSQTKESITQTSDLLTSILDSMKGIISSLFR